MLRLVYCYHLQINASQFNTWTVSRYIIAIDVERIIFNGTAQIMNLCPHTVSESNETKQPHWFAFFTSKIQHIFSGIFFFFVIISELRGLKTSKYQFWYICADKRIPFKLFEARKKRKKKVTAKSNGNFRLNSSKYKNRAHFSHSDRMFFNG